MIARFRGSDAVEVELEDGNKLVLYRANISGTWNAVWIVKQDGEQDQVPDCYSPSEEVLEAIREAERRLARRLELFFGGKARPFDLTVKEADLLGTAVEVYMAEARRTNKEIPPEDGQDADSDHETLAHLHELRQRLFEHAGYTRRRPGQ